LNAERRKTIVLFAFSFLSGSAYIMTRTVAASLFLARIGAESLPLAFAASAILVAAVTFVASKSIPLCSARTFALLTYVLLAALSLVLCFSIFSFDRSLLVLGSLYVLAELRGSANTINLITLSNEAFSASDSKRNFALVASGAPIAGIVVGILLGLEATVLGVFFILLLAIAFDLATSVAVLFMASRSHSDETAEELTETEDEQRVESSQVYKHHLAILLAIEVVVLTLVGFQWESSIGSFYGENETSMLAYFAFFYAATDMLVVLIQWFVSGKLLDRFGLKPGLCALPLLLALVGLASLLSNAPLVLVFVFTIGKGLNVLRRATYDPALSSAYGLLETDQRREAVMFNRGIVKPLAELFTAFALMAIGFWLMKNAAISYLWIVLIPPWLYFSIQIATKYRTHFHSTQMESELG